MIKDDKVFLVRHTYVPGWHFPGGGVELGQSCQASLGLEIFEETGYRLGGPGQLFNVYLQKSVSDRDHILVYKCYDFKLDTIFRPNAEIAEAGWFDRLELPSETTEATRRRLAEIFDGATVDELW
ncbi:hypothetical protein MNBD_ALPHA12-1490 [hydrothermal vent metagenome]|uniref:Nudix hydrolase domain-containing protein n=1 Tax=hydrothermal vent metagenome TaxID=652676 RepID=A0A3B0UT28_9ZZZZ